MCCRLLWDAIYFVVWGLLFVVSYLFAWLPCISFVLACLCIALL